MKDYLVKETGNKNLRFLKVVNLLADMPQEFVMHDFWEKNQDLYHYNDFRYSHPLCDYGSMKKDIKRAVSEGYLIMNGVKGGASYTKTNLLPNNQ